MCLCIVYIPGLGALIHVPPRHVSGLELPSHGTSRPLGCAWKPFLHQDSESRLTTQSDWSVYMYHKSDGGEARVETNNSLNQFVIKVSYFCRFHKNIYRWNTLLGHLASDEGPWGLTFIGFMVNLPLHLDQGQIWTLIKLISSKKKSG